MKRNFFASSVLLAFGSTSIFSQDNVHENTLVVTANRAQQDINDTLAVVEVITRDDIDRIQPESITDLFRSVAGFDIVNNGGAGQSSSLFTRGTNSDHTLVLIDGVRVGSATTSTANFATIPVSMIERIEIVKGPRAALWGSDAIGGVIQIFTRKLASNELVATLKAGSDQYEGGVFSFGFGSEKMSNTVSVSSQSSKGYDVLDNSTESSEDTELDSDGYRQLSASIHGDYTLSEDLSLNWVAQVDKGNSEFDSSYGNETDYKNKRYSIQYHYNLDKWSSQLGVSHNNDYAFTYDLSNSANNANYQTKRSQVNAYSRYSFNDNLNVIGGFDQFKESVSGSSTNYDETDRTTRSLFFISTFDYSKIIAEASIRRDDVDNVGNSNTFNLSAGFRVTNEILISLSRAKGFKSPSFNELYYPASTYFSGNSDLKPETSFNNELNIKGNWGAHSLVFAHYENDVKDLINYQLNEEFVNRPVNIDNAELSGQEFIYQFRAESFTQKFSASFIRAKDTSIDSVTLQPKNEQLIRRAKKHYSYTATLNVDTVSLYSQLKYTGERYDLDYSSWPANRVSLKSFTQIDLGASFEVNQSLSFDVKLNDITDESAQTILGYQPPGRQAFLTVRYDNL